MIIDDDYQLVENDHYPLIPTDPSTVESQLRQGLTMAEVQVAHLVPGGFPRCHQAQHRAE